MENLVINQDAVKTALKNHPGNAFAVLKGEFMELAIKTTLEQTNGNIHAAARKLGITRNTIYIWMNKQ